MRSIVKSLATATGIMLVAIACAEADTVMDASVKSAPAAETKAFFSGKSWDWGKGKGVYFAADGSFTAIGGFGSTEVGKGTWQASDGKLCWDATWIGKSSEKKTPFCWAAKSGPGKDGTLTFKNVLWLKGKEDPKYFWVFRDTQTSDAFTSGDKFSAKAGQILKGWGKK